MVESVDGPFSTDTSVDSYGFVRITLDSDYSADNERLVGGLSSEATIARDLINGPSFLWGFLCFWWRRGRVELYRKQFLFAQLIIMNVRLVGLVSVKYLQVKFEIHQTEIGLTSVIFYIY